MNCCARCGKTVYPIEELKCLDKVWHKQCFKCQECGMTLSMKNYKGYNKMPYCNAHIPQVKYTTVADTPEARRLAENTRIQSNIKYHEDFVKQKGKVTQVADDPETVRIRNTSKIISNVTYHGEYEKKQQMEQKRTLLPDTNGANGQEKGVSEFQDGPKHEAGLVQQHTNNHHHLIQQQPQQNLHQIQQQQQQAYSSSNKNRMMVMNAAGDQNQNHEVHHQQQQQSEPAMTTTSIVGNNHHIGSTTNKDTNSGYTKPLQSTVIYTSDQGPVSDLPSRKIGSIADYDPLNDNYGSIASSYRSDVSTGYYPVSTNPQSVPVQQQPMMMPTNGTTPQMLQQQPPRVKMYRAMYDYTAQDIDEVTFKDGDLIINCVPIDEGWMTGTIQRTGQSGMLPSNYVEPYIC